MRYIVIFTDIQIWFNLNSLRLIIGAFAVMVPV